MTRCFICEQSLNLHHPPYVELGPDGYGKDAYAHFVCYQNARMPMITDDTRGVDLVEERLGDHVL